MLSPRCLLGLLVAGCFTLATRLELWRQDWQGRRTDTSSFLAVLMGDSRQLLAGHFFEKADVYFHNGYYPTIFDRSEIRESSHLAGVSNASNPAGQTALEHADEKRDHAEAADFLSQPKDWIDAFGRHFFPSRHSHLEKAGEEREILPWLRLSAEMDPGRVETYVVAAYWLRTRLDKLDQAEKFLREGWKANPDSYEILFELGRIYDENRKDPFRARNVWDLALQRWKKREAGKTTPDSLSFLQITGHLARLEEREGQLPKALNYLEMYRQFAPHPAEIQKQIDELKEKIARQAK
jgi:tetratricopeptide (TPR) repeat protein